MTQWNDGTSSNYGSGTNIETCKSTCNTYSECKGFVVDTNTSVCGHYKGGTLNLITSEGHTCIIKLDATIQETGYVVISDTHCGGSHINTWSDGTSSNYGSGTNIDTCRSTCNTYSECQGFVVKDATSVCGYYKGGTLQTYSLSGYKCFAKVSAI